jgi:hypothetical protein
MGMAREGGWMKRLGIALALVCCGAGAAKADWKYTRWGMTPSQVAAASRNLTKKSADLHPDSDGNVTKLVAPYQAGKFAFEAQFGFDAADRLSSVTLVLNDKDAAMEMDMGPGMAMNHGPCHDLRMSVKKSYGPRQGGGAAHALYSIETWRDQKNKNDIKYTVLDGVGCYVQYSAIKPAKAQR